MAYSPEVRSYPADLRQLVTDTLELPRDHVRLMPTSTRKTGTPSPTAFSTDTDLNPTGLPHAARGSQHV